MRGLDPRTHQEKKSALKKMDCRVKPGNDDCDVRPTASRSRAAATSARAEHPFEDRVDVLEMEAEVEVLRDLSIAQILFHVLVGLEQRQEIAFAAPDRHRVALNQLIRVLA